MEIRPFDYEAALAARPGIWAERGVHWHGYACECAAKDYASETLRRRVDVDVPPVALRDWLRRPAAQVRGVFCEPEPAAEWLMGLWRQAQARALTALPEWVAEDSVRGLVLHELHCGNDVTRAVWVGRAGDRPKVSAFSLVATRRKCHRSDDAATKS